MRHAAVVDEGAVWRCGSGHLMRRRPRAWRMPASSTSGAVTSSRSFVVRSDCCSRRRPRSDVDSRRARQSRASRPVPSPAQDAGAGAEEVAVEAGPARVAHRERRLLARARGVRRGGVGAGRARRRGPRRLLHAQAVASAAGARGSEAGTAAFYRCSPARGTTVAGSERAECDQNTTPRKQADGLRARQVPVRAFARRPGRSESPGR